MHLCQVRQHLFDGLAIRKRGTIAKGQHLKPLRGHNLPAGNKVERCTGMIPYKQGFGFPARLNLITGNRSGPTWAALRLQVCKHLCSSGFGQQEEIYALGGFDLLRQNMKVAQRRGKQDF